MRIQKFTFIMCLFFLILSCKDKKPIITPIDSESHIKWNKYLDDPNDFFLRTSLPFQNDIIFGIGSTSEKKSKVQRRNGITGVLEWEWESNWNSNMKELFHFENYLVVNHVTAVSVLNAQTGELIWEKRINEIYSQYVGNPTSSCFNGKYYTVISKYSSPFYESSSIVEFDILTGESNIVYTLDMDDNEGFSPHINAPMAFLNSDGDDILVFYIGSVRSDVPPPQNGELTKFDVIAFNKSADTILWKKDRYNSINTNNNKEPIQYNNLIIVVGGESVHAYNKQTGEIVWENDLSEKMEFHNISLTHPLIIENKLIIKTNNSELFAFNASNGNFLWENYETSGFCSAYMKEYNNNVYFSSFSGQEIYGVNTLNGEIVFIEKSPNKNDNFYYQAVSINKEKGYLYTTDHSHGMCIDLNF